jgi:hypothetical protein
MHTIADKFPEFKTRQRTAVERLCASLAEYEPFVFHVSQDRRSWYVHFRRLPNGLTHKLRVSDHEERKRYGYKWQLRLDGIPPKLDQKYKRHYFDSIEHLVRNFRRYYDKVEQLNSEILDHCGRSQEEGHDGL